MLQRGNLGLRVFFYRDIEETIVRTWLVFLIALLRCSTASANDAVIELSERLGRKSALVVVVCEGNEQDRHVLARLVERTPWTIFCRGDASSGLRKIHDWARDGGLLGGRVYVADGEGESLWLAGDMTDAVWLAPGLAHPPSESEILRVLHPGGVYAASGRVVQKPAEGGADEWGHPCHRPDNNVVSQDRLAHLPGELRFQTYPLYAAMPNQTLLAGGRLFFFTGHIAFHEREEPLLNALTVLNAYNGLKLWSRPLNPNYVVHNLVKFATQNEVVFAEGGTLWILDAATGAERARLPVPAEAAAAGDTDWKWLAQDGNKLLAALGPPDGKVAPHRQKWPGGNWPWDVANAQYSPIVENFGQARRLAAFEYPQMKLIWSASEPAPLDARALCMKEDRIFELAPTKYMAARDAVTGKLLWRRTPETSKELFEAIGGAIKRQGWGLGWASYACARASRDVVCLAGPPFKKTIGIGFDKGDLLWTSPLESPHALFLDDAVYLIPRVGEPAGVVQKLDPRNGKLLDQFSLKGIGSCTRLTATPGQFYYRPGGGQGATVYVRPHRPTARRFPGRRPPRVF